MKKVTRPKCSHVGLIRDDIMGAPLDGSLVCAECLGSADEWVHLRTCLVCGHVGCCDESKNAHATAHFRLTGHPLVKSAEEGEDWVWCYEDQMLIYPNAAADAQDETQLATKEFLRPLPLFSSLSEEDLDTLTRLAEPRAIHAGDLLIQQGTMGDALFVVLEGQFEVIKRSGKQDVVLGLRGSGEMLGEMALLEQVPRSASVRALCDSRVLVISQQAFYQLLASNPSAVFSILRTFIMRLRSTEQLLVQQDKLAALGALAAGLAHEINNPTAAVQRSAGQMRSVLEDWQRASGELHMLGLAPSEAVRLDALSAELLKQPDAPAYVDALANSDMDEEVESWLEAHRVSRAWELAPVLVSLGWGTEKLDELAKDFKDAQLRAVVPWLVSGRSAYDLLTEVQSAAERISELVKSVKLYTFLDQAPIQQISLRDSLENTLVILKHKLKQGVKVERDYAPDLPKIDAYGSELNQVWTNIIDNAIDAMDGKGEIKIRAYGRSQNAVVEICDNGPGIPPEVQQRIFEPFYTTKAPGSGTGLGMHIVYNIIVDKHLGQIALESTPGNTCFQVTLPVKLARENLTAGE